MTDRKIDSIGWGIFFIWLGVCYIAEFSFAVMILGIGVIILGAQLIRKLSNFSFEGFWVFAGLLFLIGGIWGFLNIQFNLIPILLIAAGVLILFSVIGGKKSEQPKAT